jgi:hypothetical protein
LNSPLNYTDPTGKIWKRAEQEAGSPTYNTNQGNFQIAANSGGPTAFELQTAAALQDMRNGWQGPTLPGSPQEAAMQQLAGSTGSGGSAGMAGTSGGVGPVGVGVEWLTGKGPRAREFGQDDSFTQSLRDHDHVQDTLESVSNELAVACAPVTGSAPYRLDGLEGIPKYVRDYSTVLTFGLSGNLAVTYLGSYDLSYSVIGLDAHAGTATVRLDVKNLSSAASAFRPPVLGYTGAWKSTVGALLNRIAASGPMSATSQHFRWTEEITFDPTGCQP